MIESIVAAVSAHAEASPEKSAIIAGKEVLSYKQLWEHSLAAALKLKELGVQPQDRVVLSASSSPSFVYGYLAVHLLQAIAVPVDPQCTESRLDFIIERVRPRAVFLPSEAGLNFNAPVFPIKLLGENPASWKGDFKFPLPDAAADILFTTGTTGDPKGAVLTHATIRRTAQNINTFIGNSTEDREVVPLPLSHSFGLGRLRCNLIAGATVILVNGFTFVGNIFQAFEKWRATGFSTVPSGIAMLYRLSGEKIGLYADQLKYMEIGSAPMPFAHKEKLTALLPTTRICMHYGLTEASRSTFIEFHSAGEKLEKSIGTPTPNVSVKVLDSQFRELPPNRMGRIMVKGDNVMKEYFRDEKQTEEVFKADWLDTGDCGYVDEDGHFYLEAREKELINVGGLKVSPIEIERLLKKHESIADCACVGVADPKGIAGEVPKAFIVYNPDSSKKVDDGELIDFLKGKLETYKIPVEYEWIESIPITSSGKVQRMALKLKQQANKGKTEHAQRDLPDSNR